MSTEKTWVPANKSLVQPDGGWGWVVAVLSLLLHAQSCGLLLSMSVMYVSWLEAFGDSRGVTSWIISVSIAVAFSFGPVPAALANRYGFRVVVIVGGLLVSTGYTLSYFATSVAFLVVTIGFITGLGICFTYLPAVAVVSVYFHRRRSVAMGIGTSGIGIGKFISAPVLDYLINFYGWRGALLITGAASLHICVYGLMLRPLKTSDTCEDTIFIEVVCDDNKLLGCENGNTDIIKERNSQQNSSLLHCDTISTPSVNEEIALVNSLSMKKGSRVQASPILVVGEEQEKLSLKMTFHSRIAHVFEERPYSSLKDLSNNRTKAVQYEARLANENISMDAIFARSIKHLDRICMLGSVDTQLLYNVDAVKDNTTVINQHRQSESPSLKRNESVKKNWSCFSLYMKGLVDSINNNRLLLKDPIFLLFGISNFFTNLSFITPSMYMVDRAVYFGLDKTVGAMLISLNGVGSLFGRIFFGVITYSVFTNRLRIYIIVLSLCGVFTMLSPLCYENVVLHIAYAVLLGIFTGGYSTLVAVTTVDIMGLDKASASFGLLLTFMGLATFLGPPFAGFLFDWTGTYILPYILFGFFLVVSGLMLIPSICCMMEGKMEENQEPNGSS